jgi:hypothetical protein
MEEARRRLAGGEFAEERWHEDGIEGKQLVATFPLYEVRVFFWEDEAVATSVQILGE